MLNDLPQGKVVGLCALLLSLVNPVAAQQAPLPPADAHAGPFSSSTPVELKGFRFEGNTVHSNEILEPLLADLTGQPMSLTRVMEARDRITHHYIASGHVNSGATIPDQQADDGILTLRIHEGSLSSLTLSGHGRLRDAYLRPRIWSVEQMADEPLNIHHLQENLKLLEESPLIERINARLSAGSQPGEANLHVEVSEARPWRVRFQLDNQRAPSVGSTRGRIELHHGNLTGWGDALTLGYHLTEGSGSYDLGYQLPINRHDTRVFAKYERSDSLVIEPPFDVLAFKSDSEMFTLGIRHPWVKTLSREIGFGLKLSHTRSATSLEGEPFAFPPGVEAARISQLSLTQEWVERSLDGVLALHSSLDFGLDWLNATDRRNERTLDGEPQKIHLRPDSQFMAWTGQLQWLKRHKWWKSETLLRIDLRWASDTLLASSKFAIGGASTVRGYRENAMIRDGGAVVGLEWRIPLGKWTLPGIGADETDGQLLLIPFFDAGYGWNAHNQPSNPRQIASLGLGLRWTPFSRVQAELFWGHALNPLEITGERDMQDDGFHFQLRVDL